MYTNATLKTNNNSKKYIYHIFFILIVLRLLTPSFIASLIPSLFFLVLDYVSMLVMILFLVSYKFKPNLSFIYYSSSISINENTSLSSFNAGIFTTQPAPNTFPPNSSIAFLIAFIVFPVA